MVSEEDQKTIRWIVFPTNGLTAKVQNELKLDPHSGLTVIFRSRRGDRLKILVWDGSGLVLIYKRLESGSFVWPKVQDGTMRLSRAQFEALFEARLAAGDGAAGASSGCGELNQAPCFAGVWRAVR
ncbi:Mobile element protein [Rhodobacter sp. AKP1]|nr:Mobile element protein [Rhodobacter sp. AKP1]